MPGLIWLVVAGTTIWVGIDASNLGMRRGRLGGGFLDMGMVAWVFASLLLWKSSSPATSSRARGTWR